MSDGFDDDDDELLALVNATQGDALFRAQGEISILRAQLEALQALKADEVRRLAGELHAAQSAALGHIAALKLSVDKLEDEKKFLGNEIRSLSAKRRRVDEPAEPADAGRAKAVAVVRRPTIHVQDEWSQLCDHLWRYTVNGSACSTMDYLARVCVEEPFAVGDLSVRERTPLLACLWEYLMRKKDLRLDTLVELFCGEVLALVRHFLAGYELRPASILYVPFLVSLVNACISFKSSAVTKSLIERLVADMCAFLAKFVFALQNEAEEEEFLMHHDKTDQQRLLENFTLVLCFDLLENAVTFATQFEAAFVSHLWTDVIHVALLRQILPENTERFISATQINLVFNFVEMLSASLTESSFASGNAVLNQTVVKSLLKVFLIDISIKDDFLFYGLNRVVGNNADLAKVSQAVPEKPTATGNNPLVSIAGPISKSELNTKERFTREAAHELHLLTLRVRTVTLLEALLLSGNMDLLNLKENIKSLVRIVGFEQNHIMHQPRAKHIHMRLSIIGGFIRILYYIIDEHRNINTLIYPETLYEIFVVLMRIAFASDSLSGQAHELLSSIRSRGVTDIGVFNKWTEFRSRETAHINLYDSRPNKYVELGDIEGDFANGLEFPYDEETVEIAREILGVCVNHDEADNLYYNMTSESQA